MRLSKTIEEFITESKSVHGDLFDYTKTIYVNNSTPVIIICEEHGEFLQKPANHLQGKGCLKCRGKKISESKFDTTETFIEKAKLVHGDEYGYEKVNYTGTMIPITIICEEHGEFLQYPRNHLAGKGCNICGGSNRKTAEEWMDIFNKFHDHKYTYIFPDSFNRKTKITAICQKHGKWEVQIRKHKDGSGCRECSYEDYIHTKEQVLEKFYKMHGDRYEYDMSDYENCYSKITVICKKHGSFTMTVSRFLSGRNCEECNFDSYRKTQEEFIKQHKEIHGEDRYDYSITAYVNAFTKVDIICKDHGKFSQSPCNMDNGCPRCHTSISKPEIKWLDSLGIDKEYRNKFIKIGGRYFKPDGFDINTNTIYEFNGDYWHGNPDIFPTEKMNKTAHKTFGELYKKTIERENYLKSFGYNVISIWENDWNKIKKEQND